MLKEFGSHVISHFLFVMFIPHLFAKAFGTWLYTRFICVWGWFI